MMRHPKAEKLVDFLKNKLSKREYNYILKHVELCGRCKGELEKLRRVVSCFEEIRNFEYKGLDFNKIEIEINRRIKEHMVVNKSPSFLGLLRWQYVVAIILLIFVGIFIYKQKGEIKSGSKFNSSLSVKRGKVKDSGILFKEEEAKPISGEIILVAGEVFLKEKEGVEWKNLRPATQISEGDKIKAENGLGVFSIAQAGCVFDESRINLKKLRDNKVIVDLEEGKVFCNVFGKVQRKIEYYIQSYDIITKANGTIWGINKNKDKIEVYAIKGEVLIKFGENSILLQSPSKYIIKQEDLSQLRSQITEEDYGWLEPLLSFIEKLPSSKGKVVVIKGYDFISKVRIANYWFKWFPIFLLVDSRELEVYLYDQNNREIKKTLKLEPSDNKESFVFDLFEIKDNFKEKSFEIGYLPPQVIKNTMNFHISRIKRCYERELLKRPIPSLKLSVRFRIGISGRVISVSTISKSDIDSVEVRKCVEEVFKQVVFPPPQGGVVDVEYPISFSSTYN